MSDENSLTDRAAINRENSLKSTGPITEARQKSIFPQRPPARPNRADPPWQALPRQTM
jgi:hypothetical protein